MEQSRQETGFTDPGDAYFDSLEGKVMQRITEQEQPAKLTIVPKRKSYWYSVAAAVTLLAAGYYWFNKPQEPTLSDQLATIPTEVIEAELMNESVTENQVLEIIDVQQLYQMDSLNPQVKRQAESLLQEDQQLDILMEEI